MWLITIKTFNRCPALKYVYMCSAQCVGQLAIFVFFLKTFNDFSKLKRTQQPFPHVLNGIWSVAELIFSMRGTPCSQTTITFSSGPTQQTVSPLLLYPPPYTRSCCLYHTQTHTNTHTYILHTMLWIIERSHMGVWVSVCMWWHWISTGGGIHYT